MILIMEGNDGVLSFWEVTFHGFVGFKDLKVERLSVLLLKLLHFSFGKSFHTGLVSEHY